jgi:thiamine pyrophosphokinase
MRALIVCGGTPPTKQLFESEIKNAHFTIGADSGGYVFLGFKHLPDVVIGDLDSFKYTNHEGVKVVHNPDQETNDLEKALHFALQNGAQHCVVLGALGKRFDHTIKNISVLQQFQSKFESIIFRDDYGDLFLVTSPFKPNYTVGTVISFFPVANAITGFSSKGVKYPLSNSALVMGAQDGTSNEIISSEAEVVFDGGFLGVFVGTGEKMKKQKRN